jgi:hypothetical protein
VIQGDENAPLIGANPEHSLVPSALEILVPDRHDVVTRGLQKICTPPTDILIELDFHSRDMPERDRHDPLARHFGAISYRGENIFVGKLRIFGQNLRFGHAVGQEIEDE